MKEKTGRRRGELGKVAPWMAEKQEEEDARNRQILLVDMSSMDVIGQEEM